ncbi:MAG: hypothetical protein SH820_08855 [Xanthomonadales bacterium]|nr:hypothetical protein [Xanthomonadales bacterium]
MAGANNTAHSEASEDSRSLTFRQELNLQRWDDHRYYHHSRVNQSLHLLSASCFIATYGLLLIDPSIAVLLGWLVAMCSRQIGHFFFEPDSYDAVNHASNELKEEIKVGYNLSRKRVLLSIWALSPLLLFVSPTFFGLFQQADFVFNTSMLWLVLGLAAVLFRTLQLFFIRNVQTGLVWATKILTDPFNDFRQYLKAPLYLLKGEWIDPMTEVQVAIEEGGADYSAVNRLITP